MFNDFKFNFNTEDMLKGYSLYLATQHNLGRITHPSEDTNPPWSRSMLIFREAFKRKIF